MTNLEALNLLQGLATVKDLPGVKFSYAVVKNSKKLESIRDSLQKAGGMSEDYRKFLKAKEDMFIKNSKKDKDDKPITTTNGQITEYDFVDKAKNEKEFKVLLKKHDAVIKAEQEKEKELQELLKDKIDVDLHKVKIEFVPEKITATQLNAIMPMIED